MRTGFRFLASSHGSELFTEKTIYEYLWDYKDPVLDTSKNLAPGLVPVNNMGMLARVSYTAFIKFLCLLRNRIIVSHCKSPTVLIVRPLFFQNILNERSSYFLL